MAVEGQLVVVRKGLPCTAATYCAVEGAWEGELGAHSAFAKNPGACGGVF